MSWMVIKTLLSSTDLIKEQEDWWSLDEENEIFSRNLHDKTCSKIRYTIEINVIDGHQDTSVFHRSNYWARRRVQSWWGEWKILRKLAWQNLLKTPNRIEINVMDSHQDTPVLHRSNYRARGRVQSWWGEWKILRKLAWQNLLITPYSIELFNHKRDTDFITL